MNVIVVLITLGFFTLISKLFVKKIYRSIILAIGIYLLIAVFFSFLTAFAVDFQVRPFVGHNFKVPQITFDQLLGVFLFWPLGIIIWLASIVSGKPYG